MSGVSPTTLTYPDTSMAVLPASMAALYGDRAAVVDGDTTLTYAELDARSAAVASALRSAGVAERDVVLIYLTNSIEFVVAYYGSLRAGATVTLVNPLQPVPGLHRQIVETGAVAAFTQVEQSGRLLSAAVDSSLTTVVVVDGSVEASVGVRAISLEEFTAGHSDAPAVSVSSGDVAHVAFTGGTTGVSKGVRVLHRNVLGNVTQMIGWRAGHAIEVGDDGLLRLTPREGSDRGVVPGDAATVVVSPLFHAHALINMSFLLLCGATHVFAGRFEPGRMLALIERYRASYVTGSPAMWHALAVHPDVESRDLTSVRVVSSGAAPIDLVTLGELEKAFPAAAIVEGYGLTEATCLVSSAPLTAEGQYRLGSVGLPTFDTEVEIRAAGDPAVVLPAGERGQLWVRGPQVTDGYLGHPDQTAEQFVDGWLDTGDIAYRDADGYIYICDRAKDMLIYKGYNVYPRELEEILVTHTDVAAAAVVGREAGPVGQEPVAFLVPKAGHDIDEDAVAAFVAEQVLPYKKIRDVFVVDELPTSAAGKIQKVALRERLTHS
ncbi:MULTISPECIES: class I adenylate-forming enzyme family protein [Gordonia]|uniref:Class I adenylate-forming enzyme family protein n=1 Tax=Gordonia amicalis TaxID=89053 RepID=A0AAE4R690_9ACTN|nr:MULTISPECIES: class I adenylate-forming enzyme family protein [Gordonia]ATD70082.1 long-chain fatty acid--CoA ligase [Gordonia sp. 1D]MCZ4581668.1 class I adenylate-forming enzyme family protein [Gordonia amicalis]MDJ0455201.1 class I adenylate-forming enzyme family protein [Gordonia amicalis]MDV6306903.1 class I adenylate-forming enzyme family protein [Gordonia amicalis]MDV6311095.1 class I adenylate-forming enzyme family protein [Gordonia amicalis]